MGSRSFAPRLILEEVFVKSFAASLQAIMGQNFGHHERNSRNHEVWKVSYYECFNHDSLGDIQSQIEPIRVTTWTLVSDI